MRNALRSEITASRGATGLRLTPGELYNEGAYRQCRDHLVEQFPTLSVGDLHLLALCAYDTGDYEHSFDAAEKLSESEDTGAKDCIGRLDHPRILPLRL
jgi:hypothetical protein